MVSVLDRAKAQYAAQPRKSISVPEWGEGGVPLVVSWTPLTVRDRERIYAADERGRSPTGGEAQIRAVIFKAEDADGKKMFDGMADHDLRHNVDGAVVGRIATAILFDSGLTNENGDGVEFKDQVDAAKNV